MDGTTKDAVRNGRLLRPADQKYASDVFTDIIVGMSRKKVSAFPIWAADGIHEVVVSNSETGVVVSVRHSDFTRCVNVYSRSGMRPLFPSDRQQYREYVRMLVEVEFRDRSST